MSAAKRSGAPAPPVDQAERDTAVLEKQRNVLIDAGAGTGKTTLIVARFVELLAPADGSAGRPIERLAAVTFTRKAAGELRLRIREGLLRTLADPALAPKRRDALHAALGGLDAAWIGTIHSFADRLLRLEPIAVGLSPAYDITEETDELVREAWHEVLQSAEAGVLHELVAGLSDEARAKEAQATLLDAIEVGLRVETKEFEHGAWYGLDALVGAFIRQRDTPPPVDATVPEVDFAAFRTHVKELSGFVAGIGGDTYAQRWLTHTAQRLEALAQDDDATRVYRALREQLSREPQRVTKRDSFPEDDAGWEAWKAWAGDTRKEPVRDTPLRDDLVAPFARWLAVRLMRCFPVAVAAYEQVKARHRVVDQVDLLLKLRDLLREDRDVRARSQALFDHVFVDEFQDTDPLQAEVLLFLCEAGAKAARWDEVALAPGKLTLVGDPKQSIYRFRRADVEMYDAVREKVAAGEHVTVRLSANFRSVGSLIEWFNHRMEDVLGAPPAQDVQFDPERGVVFHAPLDAGLDEPGETPVWVMSVQPASDKAGPVRLLEAEAWARCLKWLVEEEKPRVRDPLSGAWRPVRYGDVAVLAHNTTNLGLLFKALDRFGVPWSARGGKLFLEDALHRQFLLGLRALANDDDGPAQMALWRPPFFAVDLADVAAETERLGEAKALVAELKARRLSRPPGDTARDLLERSAFGRHVALGPNGAQRLERLRELCLVLERTAAEEGLDFDGVTARLRGWAEEPGPLDPPHPVGAEAVQVLTVYQAKGLEYPVVALWDARARWTPKRDAPPWIVSRDGAAWAINLRQFSWEEPLGSGLVDRELEYQAAERRRVVYVGATRARDLLLVPFAGPEGNPSMYIPDLLTAKAPKGTVRTLATLKERAPLPAWAAHAQEFERVDPKPAGAWAADAERAWGTAAAAAGQPELEPRGVAAEAHRKVEAAAPEAPRVVEGAAADELGVEVAEQVRKGRYGPQFGLTVHRALELVLVGAAKTVTDAVRRAAREAELSEHLDAAEQDVERTLATLKDLGAEPARPEAFAVEYPLAAAEGPLLLTGFIDLLVARDGLTVIDFKTDGAPTQSAQVDYPAYVEQVKTYVRVLEGAGLAPSGKVRGGLLFTETGKVEWV